MPQETLQDLLVEELRDIYDAEKQLVKALPKMAKNADSEPLTEAIRNHLDETQMQVSRLEEAFGILGVPVKGKTCKGMKGLIEEASDSMKEEEDDYLRDLAIIAGAQRVEHYEISAYGTARTLAERLDLTDVAELLRQSEEEESQADEKLTECANTIYNSVEAQGQGEEEEETAGVSRGKSGQKNRAATTGKVRRAGGR